MQLAAAGAGKLGLVGLAVFRLGPACRHSHLDGRLHALRDRRIIHLDDFAAFMAIGVDDCVAQVFFGFFQRDDLRQFEKRDLHQNVEPAAKPDVLGELHGVDRIELDVVCRDVAFHAAGQLFVKLLHRPFGVEQEGPAGFQPFQQIVLVDIGLLRAGDEIGLVDQVRSLDRRVAEA